LIQLFKIGLTYEAIFLALIIAMAFISVNYNVTKMVFSGNKRQSDPKIMAAVAVIASLVPLLLGLFLVIYI